MPLSITTTLLHFALLTLAVMLVGCESKADQVVHRRNFSKDFFMEEFSKVQISCNQKNGLILIPETKLLKIHEQHKSKDNNDKYEFKMNEKFITSDNKFTHEFYLETIKDSAFVFRYNSHLLDTILIGNGDKYKLQLTEDKGRVVCRCNELLD